MGTTTPERAIKRSCYYQFELERTANILLREDGNSKIPCWVGIIAREQKMGESGPPTPHIDH